jgi:hypothetical protein
MEIAEIRAVAEDESLRRAARQAARKQAGGVAGLARSLRISLRSLKRFLNGEHPGRGTLAMLEARIPSESRTEPHPATIGMALLVNQLPPRLRAPAREAVGLGLAGVFEAYGAPVPEWLKEDLLVP